MKTHWTKRSNQNPKGGTFLLPPPFPQMESHWSVARAPPRQLAELAVSWDKHSEIVMWTSVCWQKIACTSRGRAQLERKPGKLTICTCGGSSDFFVRAVLNNGETNQPQMCFPGMYLSYFFISFYSLKVGKESTKCSENFRLKISTQKPDKCINIAINMAV